MPFRCSAGISSGSGRFRSIAAAGPKRCLSLRPASAPPWPRGGRSSSFPEGPRGAIGAEPDYKLGVAQLYRLLGVPCVPVALNTGLAWPRRRFLKQPYRVVMDFLEPIPAGLPAKTAFRQMQDMIGTGSDRLIDEALAEKGQTRADIQSSRES